MHIATIICLFALSSEYTLVKEYPDTDLSGRIVLLNGTVIDISYRGRSALYSDTGEFDEDQEAFLCLFVGDKGYNDQQRDCVAARFEKGQPCETTLVHAIGKSTVQPEGYCWMADTIMACTVEGSTIGEIKTFANMLVGHGKEVARCYADRVLKGPPTTTKPEKKPEPMPEPDETIDEEEDHEDYEEAEESTEKPGETEGSTEKAETTTTKKPKVVSKGPKPPGKTKEDEKLLEQGKVMWNETARLLTIIGTAASVLLFLQILVLAMSIKLIKRQAFR